MAREGGRVRGVSVMGISPSGACTPGNTSPVVSVSNNSGNEKRGEREKEGEGIKQQTTCW